MCMDTGQKAKKQKQNNAGSAIVTVLVVVTFVTILATVLLYISGMKFQMKVADYRTKESFYQAKIIRWLKEQYPGAFVWKAQAGPYCRQGIPDICAIINGHFFGFEVKRPEVGRLSKIQEQTIKEINAAGGIAAVVSFPEQVEKIILAAGIN